MIDTMVDELLHVVRRPALETRWARVRQIYPRQNYNLANCALSSVNSARIAAVKVGRTSPIAIR